MFENTSGKIKIVALILFIVGTILTVIIGIANLSNYFSITEEYREIAKSKLWWGFGLMVLGPCLSYVIALALYGEGVMIEYLSLQRTYLASISKKIDSIEKDK